MKKFLMLLFAISFFTISVFAQRKLVSSSKNIVIVYGIASYYAEKFNGRHTANGEIFRSTKYTAACNILPLNTWIKVTNLRNNKSVIVKVNDRLHYKNKRLVDLSKIAAKELHYFGRGITRVKVEVLKNFHF